MALEIRIVVICMGADINKKERYVEYWTPGNVLLFNQDIHHMNILPVL